MIRFLRSHKRLITFSSVALCGFVLTPHDVPWWAKLLFFAISAIFLGSQLFWLRRVAEGGKRIIPHRSSRCSLGAVGLLAYFFLVASNLFYPGSYKGSSLTLRAALLVAPFWLWFVGSVFGFLIAILTGTVGRLARALSWAFKKTINPHQPELLSLGRRQFLEQTAVVLSAAPFVAGTYGLFYGRLNLETTQRRIQLPRLPKEFEGFRIVQLSDIHISPFMSAAEIRRYVAIANQLKGDLIVLTGDFVTDDSAAQGAVVQVLSALKAPFGVFGCMGNHEYMTETEESITRLFAGEGIRILRQQRVPIQSQNEMLNLIGVDYQQRRLSIDHEGHLVDRYMEESEKLVTPGTVNILLNHNPNAFDRAAELGVDLMLSGHTHGGQLSLEYLVRGLCLNRLETPYISGWFEKLGSQLYVNRGIGTTGIPVRLGARPEITVFELARS